MVDESDSEALDDLDVMGEERASDKQEVLEEMADHTLEPPSNCGQYQDQFAGGLPSDFSPEVTEFFDERNRLSHWYPRLKELDIPTISTKQLQLESSGGKEYLEEEDLTLMDVLMTEDPEPVFAFFGKPDFDEIASFIDATDKQKAFLRGDYKSARNLGDGNHIENGKMGEAVRTVMHQLQDRVMANMPLFDPIHVREHLDLDHNPDGRPTLHPEVRFFIADGEVQYHYERVDQDTFARATNGADHYARVIDDINESVDQLYEWAFQAAQEFDDASWSLDFVMDTTGTWYATDMALNALYYSSEKEHWRNLSRHDTGSEYNLEEQIGDTFPEPEVPDNTQETRR